MATTIGAITVHHFDPPPPLEQKGTQLFRVPGVAGAGAVVDAAVSGKPFGANTVAYTTSASVETVRLSYASLIGTVIVLVYEGVNHATTHSTKYFVLDVSVAEAKRIPRATGTDFDYAPAGVIRASWQLVPVPVPAE